MAQPGQTVFEIDVVGDVPDGLDLTPLQRVVGELVNQAPQLGLPGGTINLALVDDAAIKAMNREYSGNDYATDVLSFNYLESGDAIDGVIGEMAISLETAQRQADEAGTRLRDEVALLALHGALHIAGYDHQTPAEQATLQQLQADLMGRANLTYREFQWQD